MRRYEWARWSLVLAFALGGACGGDAKSSIPSYVGEEKTLALVAGDEGTLAVGAAKLDVPKGAVADDVELTVAVKAKTGLPEAKSIAVDVYDYGPDGTKFEKPVKLSFDMQGVKVPKGKKAAVAFLKDGKWNTLPTKVTDGKADAETTHFTPYTLLFVPDEEVGQCNLDFEPCGGDIVGTWEFTGGCLAPPLEALNSNDGGDNPFALCDDKPVAAFSVDLQGQVVFGQDGSFSVNQMISVSGGFRISPACLAQAGESMGTVLTCGDVNGTLDGEVCVLGPNGGLPEKSEDSNTGTYSVSGTNVTVVDAQSMPDEVPDASPYCVRGDTLAVRVIEGDNGAVVVYQGRRK